MTTNTPPHNTPWGRSDDAYELAPGVWEVATPSHGGIWVRPDLNATIPATCRTIALEYAPDGWYEEDSDAIIPLVLLPGIPENTRIRAIATLWHMGDRMNPVRQVLHERELQERQA